MKMSIAVGLLIVGIILLIIGLGSADSIENAFSRLFSGHYTGRTMWLIVAGSVCLVIGLFGCYRGSKA